MLTTKPILCSNIKKGACHPSHSDWQVGTALNIFETYQIVACLGPTKGVKGAGGHAIEDFQAATSIVIGCLATTDVCYVGLAYESIELRVGKLFLIDFVVLCVLIFFPVVSVSLIEVGVVVGMLCMKLF